MKTVTVRMPQPKKNNAKDANRVLKELEELGIPTMETARAWNNIEGEMQMDSERSVKYIIEEGVTIGKSGMYNTEFELEKIEIEINPERIEKITMYHVKKEKVSTFPETHILINN